MKNSKWTTTAALFSLWLVAGGSAASAESVKEPQEKSTAVLSVQLSTRSAAAPLEMRVSVQYVNSNAADMVQVLAKAAGLAVEVPAAPLQPVTITLTNVRFRTALDAICDTAGCRALPHDHERLLMLDRKRPEQDGVCDGKDGDVRAETEGQNTGRGDRNRRIAAEKPQAVHDAVAETLHRADL